MKISFYSPLFLGLLLIILPEVVFSQSAGFTTEDVKFESQGITLAG
jgi:hypothetical protein